MGLTYGSFAAIVWTFTGLAIILNLGRYAIRYESKIPARPQDFLQGLALALLIAFSGYYTHFYDLNAAVSAFGSGTGPAPSGPQLNEYFHGIAAVQFMFWIIIYLVKFVFMFTYRDIFRVSRNFMIAWWIVLAFIFATFLACFFSVFWICGSPELIFDTEACSSAHTSIVVDNYAEMTVALNISSDLAVIALPLAMLSTLRMKTSEKLGASVIFMFSLVIIAFEIARIVVGEGDGDVSTAIVWDALEPAVSVLVGALPSYAAMLRPNDKRQTSSSKLITMLRSGFSSNKSSKDRAQMSDNWVELDSQRSNRGLATTNQQQDSYSSVSQFAAAEAKSSSDV